VDSNTIWDGRRGSECIFPPSLTDIALTALSRCEIHGEHAEIDASHGPTSGFTVVVRTDDDIWSLLGMNDVIAEKAYLKS
jgi:hypothetical protein